MGALADEAIEWPTWHRVRLKVKVGQRDSYKEAGVDLAEGTRFVQQLRGRANLTTMLAGIGGFAAAAAVPSHYAAPVIACACDGVGTKLKLLAVTDRLEVAGHDLVAMCVNDLACLGASPWLLLDYYGCDRLEREAALRVLAGIDLACDAAGCQLAGGETAELPGLLREGCFELAGFALGLVEAGQLLDPSRAIVGDVVIGIRTAGLHCNGFALVRKLLDERGTSLDEPVAGAPLADLLLAPTPLYAPAVSALIAAGLSPHAAAHITGGGLVGNLPRALPAHLGMELVGAALTLPPLHEWVRQAGGLAMVEMRTVFNGGIGMALVVAEDLAEASLALLANMGHAAARIGTVAGRPGLVFA